MVEERKNLAIFSRRNQRRGEIVDDGFSTDSGCSSGGSTGSAERVPRNHQSHTHSSRATCYSSQHRNDKKPATTRSQERLSRASLSSQRGRRSTKSSRSWSPSENLRDTRDTIESPSHSSSSPSDEQSTDSDSMKKSSRSEIFRRAMHYLKIGSWEDNGKEKKLTKKSPKRILRDPVSYTYVRGLSGLPTQRVPRNAVRNCQFCSCQDVRPHEKNPDRR